MGNPFGWKDWHWWVCIASLPPRFGGDKLSGTNWQWPSAKGKVEQDAMLNCDHSLLPTFSGSTQ
jgi:hypothetical protein